MCVRVLGQIVYVSCILCCLWPLSYPVVAARFSKSWSHTRCVPPDLPNRGFIPIPLFQWPKLLLNIICVFLHLFVEILLTPHHYLLLHYETLISVISLFSCSVKICDRRVGWFCSKHSAGAVNSKNRNLHGLKNYLSGYYLPT